MFRLSDRNFYQRGPISKIPSQHIKTPNSCSRKIETPNADTTQAYYKSMNEQLEVLRKQSEANMKLEDQQSKSSAGTVIKGGLDSEEYVSSLSSLNQSREVQTGSLKAQPVVKTFVYLALANLTCMFFLCLMLDNNLVANLQFQQIQDANDAITKAQKAMASLNIINISQEDKCNDQFQQAQLGTYPSTQSGCICPDMTTQQTMCAYPCLLLDAQPSYQFFTFNKKRYCVQYSDQDGLNEISIANSKKQNQIEINDNIIQFSRKENGKASFYGFEIQPDYPCYGQLTQPELQSKLTYPFLQKPFIGCSRLGNMRHRSIPLDRSTFRRVRIDNHVENQFVSLPFSMKYFSSTDNLNLYIIRKPALGHHPYCQVFQTFNFGQAYSNCLLAQVIFLVFTQLAVIFFIVGITFQLLTILFRRNRYQTSLMYKGHIDDILSRSVITIAITLFIVFMTCQPFYFYYKHSSQGVQEASVVIDSLNQYDCIREKPILESVQTVEQALDTCTESLDPILQLILACEVLFSLASFCIGKKIFNNIVNLINKQYHRKYCVNYMKQLFQYFSMCKIAKQTIKQYQTDFDDQLHNLGFSCKCQSLYIKL